MEWLNDFMGLFDGGEDAPSTDGWQSNDSGWDYDFKGDEAGYDAFQSDYNDNLILDGDYSSFAGASSPALSKPDSKGAWYTNPNLLGAGITAGAGLFGGMAKLDADKQNLKAQQEQSKMNNLLELAKLKHQILMKGSGGSGRGRGSGGANRSEDLDRGHSANKINQLSNLGANLSNIYRG